MKKRQPAWSEYVAFMTDTQPLAALATESPTKCPVHTRAYQHGRLIKEGFPPSQLSDFLDQKDTYVWLDMLDPDEQDLFLVTEEFGLHPLAVEDAIHDHQRPKLDHYDTHLFVSMYDIHIGQSQDAHLEMNEIAAFITRRSLITVRKDPAFAINPVLTRWDQDSHLARNGVGYLLWGLIDHVIDGHSSTVDVLDARTEELEDYLFAPKMRNQEMQRRTFDLRKDLVGLRRIVLPMREVVNALIRQDFNVVDREMAPYFQDVYDHVLRVTEATESLRDLVQSILEANLSIQSNKLNEVMKQLTAWAAIIAVPTAITGFYGQNVPYPGFSREWGFWVSTGLILAISGALWSMFRKNEWL